MDEEDKEKLGGKTKAILWMSLGVVLFSFAAPFIFVQKSSLGIDFKETGAIGDTIGGIMNPFIAIAGVCLTFLAFYIQFKANKLQRELFQKELKAQKVENRIDRFENQFYEMLRLHKENVNDIHITQYKRKAINQGALEIIELKIQGKEVFNYFLEELELYFAIAKKEYPNYDTKLWMNEAYGVFFHGTTSKDAEKNSFYKLVLELEKRYRVGSYKNMNEFLLRTFSVDFKTKKELRYRLCEGHSSQLAHYYRHLFQTVKFIANQNEKFITYENKRNYLRILRAQLSNEEQAMLFYNWLSEFGKQWENKKNKFFTDYRMIHNLYQNIVVEEIQLEDTFDLKENYRKEKDRDFDPLFEFQDWE